MSRPATWIPPAVPALCSCCRSLHQAGRTVLVVTHDPRMQHFATSTIYLLDGRIVRESDYQAASTFDFETTSEGENNHES